jgi:hypothetical protein
LQLRLTSIETFVYFEVSDIFLKKIFLPISHKKFHKDIFGDINFTGITEPGFRHIKPPFRKGKI